MELNIKGINYNLSSRHFMPDQLAREIVALANTNGGVIALGVDDKGEAVGLDRDFDFYKGAINVINSTQVFPNNSVSLECDYTRVNNWIVVFVTVQKYDDYCYIIGQNQLPQYFLMYGDAILQVSREQIHNFRYQNSFAVYPIVPYTPTSTLDKKAFVASLRQSGTSYQRIGILPRGNYYYKYMDMESAILSLQNGNIRFVEPTLWADLYEGRFYQADYSNVTPSGLDYAPFLYACCFTQKQNNEAAWKIYTYGKTGLGSRCVEFKVKKVALRKQLANYPSANIYEGVVKYLHESNVNNLHKRIINDKSKSGGTPNALYAKYFAPFGKDKYLNLLTLKRDAFEHECEVRFLIEPKLPKAKAKLHYVKGKAYYGESSMVNVNWLDVLEEVRIEDGCTQTEYNIFRETIYSIIDNSGKSAKEKQILKKKLEPQKYPIYGVRQKVTIEK